MNPITLFFLGAIALLFLAALVGPRIEQRLSSKDK